MRCELRVHLHGGVKVHFHLQQQNASCYHDNIIATHTHREKIKGSYEQVQQGKKAAITTLVIAMK